MGSNKKKIPLGIVVIAILSIISGIVLIAMSVASFMFLLPSGIEALWGSSFLLLLGAASIVVSIGLFLRKGWSWTLLLIISGFGAAGYLLNIVNGNFFSIVGLVINAVVIYYLYKPNIRKFFGK